MGLETTGRIYALFDTQQVTERFRKREFVVELADNPQYPQFVQFQMTGNRCENLDGFEVGDEVRVEFSLRGREWKSPQGETRFFNSLDVWTLDKTGGGSSPNPFGGPPSDDIPPPTDDDDIPF
jgi:hypothetical protein